MVCWATETSMNNIFNMGNLLLALGILVSISAFVCLYYAYKEDEREKRDSARAKKAAKTRAKNKESKETLIAKTVSKPSNKKKTKSKKSK